MIEHESTRLDPLTEFRLKHIEAELLKQEDEIKTLENKNRDLKEFIVKQERSRLKWGISSLGSLVMLLGSILWSYRSVIFKGNM